MTTRGDDRIRNYLEWSDEGNPTIWRYMGVFAIVLFLWQLPQSFLHVFIPPPYTSPVVAMAVLVAPFVVAFFSVPLATKLILKRPAFSIALPSWPPRWGDWFLGASAGLVIIGVTSVVLLPLSPLTYRGWGAWSNLGIVVPFLVLAVVGLFFQTGFEEMWFRGFSEQLVRKYTKNVWLFLGVPAFAFASRHIGNVAEFGSKWTAMLPYLFFALSLAWAAWRTGSLVMSMGLHFGNNLAVAIFVSTKGDVIPTLSPFVNMDASLTGAIASGRFRRRSWSSSSSSLRRRRGPRCGSVVSGRRPRSATRRALRLRRAPLAGSPCHNGLMLQTRSSWPAPGR